MDQLITRAVELLESRPGLTRERLAQSLGVTYDESFRETLSVACDAGLLHKIHDKYYPGSVKSY
jgi:hypothetical protein